VAIGQRGKEAEKEVNDLFTRWNAKEGFSFHRLPDARSARSFLKAQPADFIVAVDPHGGIFVEVKDSQHPYRIAKDKVSQLPTLRKFDLAGMRFLVLVKHTEQRLWRVIPPSFFDGDIPPSWDLRSLPLHESAEAALRSTGLFEDVL
jgi:hypothetical protein